MINNTNTQEDSLTKEELDKLSKFYDSNMQLLKKQKAFEELRADIEEARLKRMIAIYKMASLHHQAKPEQTSEEQTNTNHNDQATTSQ